MFNLFKKKNIEVNEINNIELIEKVKTMTISVLTKNNINVNSISLTFKYLVRNDKGLQSMFTINADNNKYYFCISNDEMQLLDEKAKDFFE